MLIFFLLFFIFSFYFHFIFILFSSYFHLIFILFSFSFCLIFIFLFLFLPYLYCFSFFLYFILILIFLFYQNFVHLAFILFTRLYSNQRIEVLRSVQVALQLLFTIAYSIESNSNYKTTIPGCPC